MTITLPPWFWLWLVVICLLAGVGLVFLLRTFGEWLISKIDDEGNWISQAPHVPPARDSQEYEWHRETCDVCYGAELEQMAKKAERKLR